MKLLAAFALIIFSATVFGNTEFKEITYTAGSRSFKGIVVKPVKTNADTKTVMIVHEWWGLNDYPKMRAEQLAKKGYIAFCVDMFGDGRLASDPGEAQKLAGEVYSSPEVLKERFMAAYQAIIAEPFVNKDKMAAIGYCFGGTVVLNAAKMGVPLDAVVSFHGGLNGVGNGIQKFQPNVLVLNGEADKMVSEEDIQSFKKAMEAAGNPYTFVNYPDATHAFTNPKATETGKKFNMPIAYNAEADKRSFKELLAFLKKEVK